MGGQANLKRRQSDTSIIEIVCLSPARRDNHSLSAGAAQRQARRGRPREARVPNVCVPCGLFTYDHDTTDSLGLVKFLLFNAASEETYTLFLMVNV